ncbi:hypothetical protein KJ765_01970 [Candidatus Micrarchaeota archaeon]|nr:hypothetical protein [Candidatus Micrarchaeota archaeon]
MAEEPKIITIRRIERPRRSTPEDELDWLCKCFGFSEQDDLRKHILQEILEAERQERGVRSHNISIKMHVTRGGAVYHLNKMIESGLIVRNGREYELRGQNLEQTLEEMEEDMLRMFKRMRNIAKELDEDMGLQ